MPRATRTDVGNYIYHVINRANARTHIFKTKKDFQAFEKVLEEAKERTKMRILAYCIMSNHWHLVLYPRQDGDLAKFIGWLTLTHTQRHHTAHGSIGSGHLYQGRYKSFLVQKEEYFLQLCRYVEQNPLRAKLVKRAQDWEWSSIWRRWQGSKEQKQLLSNWPVPIPKDYIRWVNAGIKEDEFELIQQSMKRGRPYGGSSWASRMVNKFGLEITTRRRGRPKKGS